ncbi:hypothetical protein QTP88_013227 [Uroleucon formosanum]
MSSLWPEIKNSVTRPDDLLRKLKGVDVWSKRDSDGKRDRKRKGERYREDTLPLSFTSQCRIKQIKLFSFFFLCLFSIFFFFLVFSFPRLFHDDDDDDRFSPFADTYRYIKSMYTKDFCGHCTYSLPSPATHSPPVMLTSAVICGRNSFSYHSRHCLRPNPLPPPPPSPSSSSSSSPSSVSEWFPRGHSGHANHHLLRAGTLPSLFRVTDIIIYLYQIYFFTDGIPLITLLRVAIALNKNKPINEASDNRLSILVTVCCGQFSAYIMTLILNVIVSIDNSRNICYLGDIIIVCTCIIIQSWVFTEINLIISEDEQIAIS